MTVTPLPTALAPGVSHNQVGQKLGRKGQETRERILTAVLDLLADRNGPPVTLSGVAKEARVRPPNVYLYFPDMGDLLLAALARVMATAEEAYLAQLRQRWPDEALQDRSYSFLQAYYEFWEKHARLLHMRNAMADAGDLRVLRYRNDVTLPLIRLLAEQIGIADDTNDIAIASVLMTGLERVATVVTNPQFGIIIGTTTEADQRVYVRGLIEAEAEVLSVVLTHRRTLASQASHIKARR
jgi:AcrR family transcriptional regulator